MVNQSKKFSQLLSLPSLLLLTAALFVLCLKNGFINWDDPEYILENPLIRDISFRGILKIFTTLQFNGFLPVTQLSLGLDYFFWQYNPFGYHLTNLLLHLTNTTLVYFLALRLTERKNAALITCLLFAIHPTRVESVAWASERKDVLYAFFYLLSILAYLKYLKNNLKREAHAPAGIGISHHKGNSNVHLLLLCFLLYTLSVFSKWSAFPLPFILLLLDYFTGRKINLRAISEKIFFLMVPAVSVFLHVSKGNIVTEPFSFFNRIFLGCYSTLLYLSKFLFPFNLSAIYPYPKIANGFLPVEYYLSLPAVLVLIWIVYLIARKYPAERRFFLFCILFSLINIGMVLHFLYPIGGVVVAADRYAYISFFGLFLLLGVYAEKAVEKSPSGKSLKNILLLILSIMSVFYSVQIIGHIKSWKNSIVFFNDIIKKDPSIAFAWNNLGFAEADEGKQQQAIVHYTKAIELNPKFSFAFNNRALAYDATGQFDKAIADFNNAIYIKERDATLFFNRGLTYYHRKDYQNALRDMASAIEIKPSESKYFIKSGAIRNDMGDYQGAVEDFLAAIKLSPENSEAFNYLGVSYNYLHRLQEALAAYDQSIALLPGYSSAYNNRGWVKFTMKDMSGAMKDFSRSIELDSSFSFPYHNRGLLYHEMNMPGNACKDWEFAAKLGYENSGELIRKYCGN